MKMTRRMFISLLATVAAWPLMALAQQNSAPRKVGVLFPGVLGADRERLINEGLASELGGEKAVLLVRSGEGDDRLLMKYASELAAGADIILAVVHHPFDWLAVFDRNRIEERLGTASISNQVPSSNTHADSPARTGLRWHQRQPRSSRVTGRAALRGTLEVALDVSERASDGQSVAGAQGMDL